MLQLFSAVRIDITGYSRLKIFQDHICSLLSDHNNRTVGVPPNYSWHHTAVHNSQPLQTSHSKRVVQHGSHGAGSHRVVDGQGEMSDITLPVGSRGKVVLQTRWEGLVKKILGLFSDEMKITTATSQG